MPKIKFLDLIGLQKYHEATKPINTLDANSKRPVQSKVLNSIVTDLKNSISNIGNLESLKQIFLNKKGDKMEGKLRLTENINYGSILPENGLEGEIFFTPFNGDFPIDISAPTLSENGTKLENKYIKKGDVLQEIPNGSITKKKIADGAVSTETIITLSRSRWFPQSDGSYAQPVKIPGLQDTDKIFIDTYLSDSNRSNQEKIMEAWGSVFLAKTVNVGAELELWIYSEKIIPFDFKVKILRIRK